MSEEKTLIRRENLKQYNYKTIEGKERSGILETETSLLLHGRLCAPAAVVCPRTSTCALGRQTCLGLESLQLRAQPVVQLWNPNTVSCTAYTPVISLVIFCMVGPTFCCASTYLLTHLTWQCRNKC